jgi:membrane-associated protease RseP (regulator of RpoE activity)
VILICVMALVRSVTVQKPDAPSKLVENLVEERKDSTDLLSVMFGSATYDDFLESYGDYDYNLETDKDEFLLAYNDYQAAPTTALTIEFPEIETLDGLWAFKSGNVRLRGAYSGTFNAERVGNWAPAEDGDFDVVEGATMRSASPSPYLRVDIPLRDNLGDEALQLEANLTITYPMPDGDGWRIEEQTFTRNLTVLLASNEYYVYREEYSNWQRSRRVIETPLWAGLIVLVAGAGGTAFYLVRRGALRPSGGFVMVVKRAGGVQQLGVEAHPLESIDIVLPQDIEGGAVLGLVKAQSPAGRSGLRSGDVVYLLDGKAVRSPRELNRLTSKFKKGDQAMARVLRDGERVDVIITF